MSIARPAVGVLLGVLGAASCGRCKGDTPPAPAVAASASGRLGEGASPGRCTLLSKARFGGAGDDAGEEPVAFGAEIGGAATDASWFYLGVRGSGANGALQVLRIAHAGGAPAPVPVDLSSGTSAPLVAAFAGRTVAAVLENQAEQRVLHVREIGGASLGDVVQSKDESEFGAIVAAKGGALVIWDDVAAGDKDHRGRIRARRLPSSITLPLDSDAGAKPSDAGEASFDDDGVISPATSDAAWPVVVPSPGGDRALVLWLAEKPEAESDGGGEPSQAEAYRWVEAMVIDVATGKPLGVARALTSSNGHAQTVAAAWVDGGFIAVVRDDPRPTDGDGGELLAVKVSVDGSGALGELARASIETKDVAPGVAYVIPRGGGAWVSYLGLEGDARLAPLFLAGTSSIEPLLASRRIVASFAQASREGAPETMVLTTKLAGSAVEIAVARCAL